MFTPANSRNLKDIQQGKQLIRLGLQGAPGTGKTWAALTFPNPIVIDFDNKLGAHSGKDIVVLPFYSEDWLLNELKIPKKNQSWPVDRTLALKKFLRENAANFTADSTVILDSWTALQNWVDVQLDLDPPMDRDGKYDKYKWWKIKLNYAVEITGQLRGLNCNVVVIFHEQIERNDEGTPTGKLNPLMSGQFKDQIQANYSDFYRQHAISRYKDPKNPKSELLGTDYLWQVRSDNLCNCTCSKPNLPLDTVLVPANYSWFNNS